MTDAFAGDSSVPVLNLVYGEAGGGKTTDAIYSMSGALFLPVHADAIRSSATTCGVRLRPDQVVPCKTLSASIAVLLSVRQHQDAAGVKLYTGAVCDDLTLQAKNELRAMQSSGAYNTKKEGSYDRQIWTDLMGRLADLTDLMRYDLGVHALFNAHRKGPQDVDGVFWKGGPDMPAKSMVKDVPHLASSVYQSAIDSSWPGDWKGVYRCNLSTEWHMKCRLGWQQSAILPMNIAELMRQAAPVSFVVPRHEDVAWIEPFVKGATSALLDGKKGVAELLEKKLLVKRPNAPRAHLDWIMRDATARAYLVRLRSGGTLASRWGV